VTARQGRRDYCGRDDEGRGIEEEHVVCANQDDQQAGERRPEQEGRALYRLEGGVGPFDRYVRHP